MTLKVSVSKQKPTKEEVRGESRKNINYRFFSGNVYLFMNVSFSSEVQP